MILNPKPYSPNVNRTFGNTIIVLRDEDFAGVKYKTGQIAVTYQSCFFKKLIIQNGEDVQFEEVSLGFFNCYIEELIISDVLTSNVTINIHASMLSGRVNAINLRSISLGNCILISSVFLITQKSVSIAYTTENIFPYWWSKIFRKIGKPKYKRILRQRQDYHIEKPGQIAIRSTKKADEKSGRYINEWENRKEYRIGYKLTKAEADSLKIHLTINYGTISTDSATSVDNVVLQSLSLSGIPLGKINIDNVEVSNLYLSNFEPQNETVFYNLTPRPLLIDETKVGIHKCNFDHVWFDNVEFNKFDRLSFYRSKLSKATFTSCSFPDKYERFDKFLTIPNIHLVEERPNNYHKDQYEMLLQLKKAFESTGNYYEGLKLQAISYAALHQVKAISRGDKIILRLNRVSNGYGLSLKKPTYWFFRLTISFYLIYLWSLGMLFQPTKLDLKLIGYYFSFIDITHWSDFLVNKSDLTGLALTVDYLNKVVIGYLVFQFISAFRKYSKNG
ncbi:hypothetical protein [Mucilaginibacter sp. OK098]|uniref:hypothetical protein n=1 Tax=Mucilaginibacter sp. OK098 TaxID=1855297 RepID=UPI00091FEF74|nr:hypothetical protein [Mucilaginibacter sp. OK098]SHN26029.1 hypothetical protein SAMN05216524_107363 [Mucilaginibacter sp. OK098]